MTNAKADIGPIESSAVGVTVDGPKPEFQPNVGMNTKKFRKEMLVDLTAGSVGGIACVYAGQPFDTVKVKMQISSHLYKNSTQCIKDMIRKDGFKSFYAGTTPALVANIGENAVLFLCYGQCKKIVQFVSGRDAKNLNAFHQACSGSLASFFSSIVLCPLELIKCRLQTARELGPVQGNVGPSSIVKEILKNDGMLGFYRGFIGTLAREVPGYFFFFGGYAGTQYILSPSKDRSNESLSLWRTVVSGGVGGLCLWATIYPADVIKSRAQVETGKASGFVQSFNSILRKEGPQALYRGIVPCLLRAFPANAALFVAYEWTKKVFD